MTSPQIAKLSVIIPCYRCASTIERSVASIASQTMLPAEVILVDDKSNDTTIDKLRQLKDLYKNDWIKIISLPVNSGPSVARNTGWDAATQDYIAFLDADDSWHHKKIEIQYNWMKKIQTSHYRAIFAQYQRVASYRPRVVLSPANN